MRLAKCSNNHYYDADQYSSCPHCQKSGSSDYAAVSSGKTTADSRHTTENGFISSFFHSLRGKTEQPDPDKTVCLEPPGLSLSDRQSNNQNNNAEIPIKSQTPEESSGDVTIALQDAFSEAMVPPKEVEDKEIEESPFGKTVSFYDLGENDPVVGWLVCVEGEYQGEGFALKAGRNLIGRSMKMDIALVKESGVSRECHASLIYEPKNKVFMIQPGDVRGLTYLNDELLLMPKEIKDFDILQLGNCKLLFRSLCGDSFSWENYI